MIDQTATTYDAPSVYLPRLIEWAEACEKNCAEVAVEQAWRGNQAIAESYVARSAEYRETAARARERLVDISELTLADVQADEPPSTLVDLTAWLREKLGRFFPSAPSEAWQTIAWVLSSRWRP